MTSRDLSGAGPIQPATGQLRDEDCSSPQPQSACVQVEGLRAELARRYPMWADGSDPLTDLPALKNQSDWVIAAQALDRLVQVEAERDTARATLAHLLDQATYGDSYGVHGSDFTVCRFCEGGGAPNVAMEHKPDCPVAMNADVVAEWFAEMEDNRTETLAALHQRDAARKALEEIDAALQCAKSLMIASGWWANPAGYNTDAALWLEKAEKQVLQALQKDPSS